MALTTIAQIEAVLGRVLTPGETTRATELIPMVADTIVSNLGRNPEADTYTATIRPTTRGLYIVPHFPLASIGDITRHGTDPLEPVPPDELDDVHLTAGFFTLARHSHPRLNVTYTTATIGALSLLAAQMVARSIRAGTEASTFPSIMAGLRQLTIGRWSATRESSAGADPIASFYLTETDLATLDAWRDRRS